MFQLKNVLVLAAGALMAFGMAACDADDDDDDADGDVEETVVKMLKIIDTSTENDADNGTTGADICNVAVACADTDPTASYSFEKGEGYLCTGSEVGGAKCSSGRDRASVDNWEKDSDTCDDNAGDKTSGYISLGLKGVLTVKYSENINGCELSIVESTGGKVADSYKVMACVSDDDCTEVIASGSGDKSIDINL